MDLPNEMKGRAKGMAVPNAPMQEERLTPSPTQQNFLRPKPLYRFSRQESMGKSNGLCA